MTSIGEYAFGCSSLTSVVTERSTPVSITSNCFSNRANATLYVPVGSKTAYEAADYWKEFKEIKEIDPNVSVTGISLTPTTLNFKRLGKTQQLLVTILPENATNKSVNWASPNPAVCTVSETGLVTATGAGTSIVIATTVDGGKVGYCTVNVTPTDHATFTMNANGIATFSDEDALDFTSVEGLKAYIASGYSPSRGELTLTRDKVPAGEGLLLKGAAGSYEVHYAEVDNVYANMLVGVPTATTVNPTEGEYTNFILANGANGIGFYTLSAAGEIGPNKAYLQLPTSALPVASSRQVRMVFDDEEEVTGIENLTPSPSPKGEGSGYYYALDGRKLMQKPAKAGLYVKDGKKVFVK